MLKKLAFAVAGLVVIVVAAGCFLYLNLDIIIKHEVEKYASAATKSDVTLSSVKLDLTSGQGTLSGLDVANPKGFSTPKAFELGSIDVAVDINSIRGTGPIVIKSIDIEGPQVTYELLNSGDSNLQALQKNAEAYANSLQGSSNSKEAKQASSSDAPAQPARKIIIDDLVIRNGRVAISQELLKGKQLGTSLPEIHLTNIGKSTGGATAAQVAQQVISAISNAAAQSAVTELAKDKISGLISAVPTSAIGGAAADAVGNSVKSIFGK